MLLYDGIFLDDHDVFLRHAVRQENLLKNLWPGLPRDARPAAPDERAGEALVLLTCREFAQKHIRYLWHN